MSLTLTPLNLNLKTLSDISYPVVPTYTTYTPLSPLSPLSPSYITNTNPLTVVTPLTPQYTTLAIRPTVYFDYDTGLNDSFIVQQDVTKYFQFKTLDKWIYTEFPSVLKYLVSNNNTISLIKKISDKDSNDISKDSESILEAKSNYIEKNILTEMSMRDVLKRIMRETGLKWFELPYKEGLIKEIVEKYIKRKFQKLITGEE
jgi:hypothetical protein